jgi:hypothetical protein
MHALWLADAQHHCDIMTSVLLISGRMHVGVGPGNYQQYRRIKEYNKKPLDQATKQKNKQQEHAHSTQP